MQALKRPVPIDVVVFDPTDNNQPFAFRQSDFGTWEIFNLLHNSWIGIKPGDYVGITLPQDTYPIDRETFERTYDVVEG